MTTRYVICCNCKIKIQIVVFDTPEDIPEKWGCLWIFPAGFGQPVLLIPLPGKSFQIVPNPVGLKSGGEGEI